MENTELYYYSLNYITFLFAGRCHVTMFAFIPLLISLVQQIGFPFQACALFNLC